MVEAESYLQQYKIPLNLCELFGRSPCKMSFLMQPMSGGFQLFLMPVVCAKYTVGHCKTNIVIYSHCFFLW